MSASAALEFYTETLDLVTRDDREFLDGFRWLSVSPAEQSFLRLALVPADREHPASSGGLAMTGERQPTPTFPELRSTRT